MRTRWNVSLDRDLADRIERRMFNPVTGKPRWGGRSELIQYLLVEWLKENEHPLGRPAGAQEAVGAS